MRVVAVEPHGVIAVPGFALKTFQCVGCGDVEKRMSFDGTGSHRTVALVPDPVERSVEAPRVSAELPRGSKVIPLPVREVAAESQVANSRVKAILGSLVRLRGAKPGS
jgi:hypothetical protein